MEYSNGKSYPLISVITPTYNSERFIRKTIESAQAQTYTNWEMIIVDDCSTDRTVEIIEELKEHDSRIQLIKLNENCGPAIARNVAIERAKGRYLAFWDCDDQWMPEKLEKQLKFMQEHRIAFSFTKYMKIKEDGSEKNLIVDIPNEVNYKQLLKHNVIGCLTVMLDIEMIGEVKMINIRSRQDFVLWLTICKRGFTAYGFQEVLSKYRVVKGSLSSNKLKMAKQMWKVYREIEELSLIRSIWCFLNYLYFAIRKYSVV